MVTHIKPEPRFIRPKDFIEQTGLAERHVYLLLEAGELRSVRVGRSYYIPREELEDFFSRAAKAA